MGKNHAPKHLGKSKGVVVGSVASKAPQKAHKPAHRVSGRLRIAVITLMIASGVAVGGDFAWKAWLSDFPAAQAQEQALNEFDQKKANKPAVEAVPAAGDKAKPASKPATEKPAAYSMKNLPEVQDVPTGEVYGAVRVPAFGAEWNKPLTEGNMNDWEANNALLDRLGVVHYQSTSQPGETGNFAIAGHRNGYGSVFGQVDILKKGNAIEVETLDGTFIYSVIEESRTIAPTDNSVLDSNPLGDEKNTTRKLLTITTCGWWNDAEREVVVAELTGFKAS